MIKQKLNFFFFVFLFLFLSFISRVPSLEDVEVYRLTFCKENPGNKCAPWLFLKTIPLPLAGVQTSKVNTTLSQLWGNMHILIYCISWTNTVFFLSTAFEPRPRWKLEKYTPYKYVCFHHWTLEYKLHSHEPHVSICLCKLRLDDLNCSSLHGNKTNIEKSWI